MKILHIKYNMDFRKWGLSLTLLSLFLTAIPMQAENYFLTAKISIEEAFTLIGIEYGVHFNYDRAVVADVEVDYEAGQFEKVEDALQSVFSQTHLKYEIFDQRYVAVYRQDREGVESMKKMVSHIQQVISTSEDAILRSEKRVTVPLASLSLKDIYSKRLVFNVSGTVVDQDGVPLIGVNIQVKGSNKGASTDFDGNFTLEDIDENAVLVVSYIGYQTLEVQVGGKSHLSVTLTSDAQLLDEVIVTAFGIEREKKSITYSAQSLEGEAISNVGNTNVLNSLQGKVAGLMVQQRSGQPGSAPRITIRGSRTFTGNNDPLYIVDGLPISGGGRTMDLNPNDIKSINVLKGPTAAALYGMRASNGVIIIETNSGMAGTNEKPNITFETNYSFDQLARIPDLNTTYAQGENGKFVPFSAFSWGPRIDTLGVYINELGEEEVAGVYDNIGNLYKTGGSLNTNLNISNNFKQGSYSFNLGYTNQEGILDNFRMNRINTRFAGTYNLTPSLKISTSINYSNYNNYSVNVPWWGTFAVPSSYDLKGKPTHVEGEPFQQINFRGQHDNFYWALQNNLNNSKTNRTFGSINLNYVPFDWLEVNYLIGLDGYFNATNNVSEKGSQSGRTNPPSGGSIANASNQHLDLNSNLSLRIKKEISENLDFNLLLGNEIYDIKDQTLSQNGKDIIIGGFHHISNTADQTTSISSSWSRTFGLYGALDFNWRNGLFLDFTLRRDMVSNMPRNNRSYIYPSIGLSSVFTEFLSISEDFLTFGKVRASVAEVGQAGPAHSTRTVYVTSNPGGFVFPYQGISSFTHQNRVNSENLRPENTRTLELGTNLIFSQGLIDFDYTYYKSISRDQIYNVPIAPSTGYTSELRNAGEMEVKGHELILGIRPVNKESIRWKFNINFSRYRNLVNSLSDGIDQLEIAGGQTTLVARVGEEFPSMLAWGYLRDRPENGGDIIVDNRKTLSDGSLNPRYGMPLRTRQQILLGSVQPKFEMGFSNHITYKNFDFQFQIDWRNGGLLYSGYNRLGKLYGILSQTVDRENGAYIISGKKGYYGDGDDILIEGANDIEIFKDEEYFRLNQDQIQESNVYDASFIKLREVRLSYNLSSVMSRSKLLQNSRVFVIASNPWLIKSYVPHFDPEEFNTSQGESYNSYPQIKSFGIGLSIDL